MTKNLMAMMRFALMVLLVTAIVSGLSLNLRKVAAQDEKEAVERPIGRQPVMVSEQNPSKVENDNSNSPSFTLDSRSNTNPISIPGSGTIGNGSPYPSTISVSGLNPLTTKVAVTLRNLSHTFPDDIDIILVGPQGQRSILMSDAGGNVAVNNNTITIDPFAPDVLPDSGGLSGNLYRPANYAGNTPADNFPAPGPGNVGELEPADLGVFNGTNPNGTWSLYVVDDENGDSGMIAGGWTLTVWGPTVYTVNSTADTSDGVCDAANCTLREAIAAAGSFDLINFSPVFDTPQTINLQTPLPDITHNITIQGKGANLLTVRRAFNAATNFRIFNIAGGVSNVAISGMTITGGNAGNFDFGGGIRSLSNLTLTGVHITGNAAGTGGGVALSFDDGVFTNCTFSGNTATNAGASGGGIYYRVDGNHTLRISNSTVSGNSSAVGGGITNLSNNVNGRMEIINSTITGNSATNGGGILTAAGNAGVTTTTTLRNTIVAGNSPNNLLTVNNGDAATFITNGFNLSDNYNGVFTPLATDKTGAPRLAPLALYGGTTPTHALLADSPALDAGDSSGYTTEQRGRARVFNISTINNASDGADIGAVEMQAIIISNTNNNGAGSLRNAVDNAPANSDIIFDADPFNNAQTITLTTGELVINRNLNIIGPGANLLTVSGNNATRVFQVASGFTASLSGVKITGGNANGDGGGIFNGGILTVSNSFVAGNTSPNNGGGIGNGLGFGNFARLTVTNSTISGNTANNGGGINSNPDSTITVSNSTISGNTANGGGTINSGGIISQNNLTISNSTISGNSTTSGSNQGEGGGIYLDKGATITNCTITNNSVAGANSASGVFRSLNGAVIIRNSIIAANVNNANQPDVVVNVGGILTSQGYNLIGNRGIVTFNQTGDQSGTGASPLNPRLAPLVLNGGTTQTHALLGGSTALDAGNSSGFLTDQRGSNRTVDLSGISNVSDSTDIGAFEAQTAPSPPPTVVSITRTNSNPAPIGGTVPFTVVFSTSVTGVDASDFALNTTGLSGAIITGVIGSGTTRIVTVFLGTGAGTVRLDLADNDSIVDGANIPLGGLGTGNGNFNTGETYNVVTPAISINDVSQNEGNSGTTNFNFTVSLDISPAQTVTVSYQTANGTATAPSDYTAIGATTLTFNPGQTSKQVTVLVNGDTTVEPDETFFVNLSAPTNATISDNQGQGTIINDDGTCNYNLSPPSPQSVPAASSNLNVSVTTQTGCGWTATTSTGWIHINSGSSGNGNGTVGLSFDANSGAARNGSLTIAGQTYAVNQAAGTTTVQHAPFDFDGDNKTDLSVFRPSDGVWWINRSSTNQVFAAQFGISSDKLVPADYTGDGKTDIAFFRPSTGEWFILRSEDFSFFALPFGLSTDIPVPADFDGDGKADQAVFRPSNSTWFIRRSSDTGVTIVTFGSTGDVPVPADYDGDAKADIAIFRPSNGQWWLQRTTAGLVAVSFGNSTDKLVEGDYTGDGKADVAIFRPSTGEWFVLRSENFSFYAVPFGIGTDLPTPGDYDGDGKFDTAVFRPSNSTWFVNRSTAGTLIQTFGISGDKPTPNAFVR